MENRTQKLYGIPLLFFPTFRPHDHGAALKIELKMSDLNIAFDQLASRHCNALHFGNKQTALRLKS